MDRVRRDRSQSTSPSDLSDGLRAIDQSQTSPHDQSETGISHSSWVSTHDQSKLSSSPALQNGTSMSPLPLSSSRSPGKYGQSSHQDDTPKAGYFEGPAEGLAPEEQPRRDLLSSSRKYRPFLHFGCRVLQEFSLGALRILTIIDGIV